jgi:hypothetical protein
MHGLTVRWSLVGCRPGVEEELAAYVEETSHAKFTGLRGLHHKTWRLRPGEWFEGCYVFETAAAREEFERDFRARAVDAPGSRIVGAAPVLVEPCVVVAVAEGAAGFRAAATYAG